MVVVGASRLRVSLTRILNFMRDRIFSAQVQRVEEISAREQDANRTHGKARRPRGCYRIGWHIQRESLRLNRIGIAIEVECIVAARYWKRASCVIGKVIAGNASQ